MKIMSGRITHAYHSGLMMKNDTFSPLVNHVQSIDQDEACFSIGIIQKNNKNTGKMGRDPESRG